MAIRYRKLSEYLATEGLGGFFVESDGTVVTESSASAWDDVAGSLTGRRLSSTTGKVDYDWDENAVVFQSGGSIATSADIVNFNVQMPHAMKTDSTVDLHIHWEQDTATAREFTIKHRTQNNGVNKTSSWTTTVVSTDDDPKFAYPGGTINQISDLVAIDMTGYGISAVIQFQIARTDSETGDLNATFIDLHVEKDTLGSRQEYVK